MRAQILQFLDVKSGEGSRVGLLVMMSFFMGFFLATISVASQTLFLQHFDEKADLPMALLVSGAFGLVATILYNFLQNRISFPSLAILSLLVITVLTAFIEFGESFFSDSNTIFFLGFTQIIPFSFILYLNFWGAFSRLFNLRQSKRLVGTVDMGALIASFIAFFSIPQLLDPKIFFEGSEGISVESLYTISLVCAVLFLITFIFLSIKYLSKGRTFAEEKAIYQKLRFNDFRQNRYIFYMSLFVVASMMALNFVDYSFLNVTTLFFTDQERLGSFISYFEMTIVIFSFLFQTLATDRIIQEYGMRVALLVSPLLIGLFTLAAIGLGLIFGYSPTDNLFVIFFLVIAVSKLFTRSLKDSLDNPAFKLYLLPIESHMRIDVQTKIEGLVTAFASLLAGALIILINRVELFDLLYISIFTFPLLIIWYIVANRMHVNYRYTLQETLSRNKSRISGKSERKYTVSTVLEKEINSTAEDKVLYGLTLMEKLEPAVFETTITRLASSESSIVRKYALEKIQALGLQTDSNKTEIRSLAERAYGDLEDSDLLSISPEKLLKLSKSVKQGDRILATKLLRKLISQKTIFILLELLRDADPKVRYEALYTSRKVKRQETWPVLIELLGSPSYSHHAAAALKEVGESVLPTLESAFHKSGQSDLVMLRIVQIMGRIGGRYSLQLQWKKADYPDKRIVKQILYSLRYLNYQARGREVRDVLNLLESEIGKAIWNLAALDELSDTPEFFFLKQALQEEVSDNYDQIYMLLSILYDPQSVQLVRENIETREPDNIAFAMELLDLFIDQELKPKLLPLLDDSPTPVKLKHLQLHFARESYNPIQVINYILNRDFNLNNRWTKACAVHASAFIPDFRISRGLIAQMFNKDKLLQETAAWVIYHKDRKAYNDILERLPERDKKFIDSSIENNQLLDGLNDGFFLWIEMVMFIKQMPNFKDIHGALLSDLADKITPLDLDFAEKIKFNHDAHNAPLLLVAFGSVKLKNNGTEITTLNQGSIYGELFSDGYVVPVQEIEATERSVVFKVNLMDFYFVMANHHELVQGLIRNINEENKHPIPQP
ncbi:MFS transporter [Ohtaekwangia koreensis]|uniref:ATP/ADP translocase n=1 Tax=Ohtaekwangia koreensis TaxID=688867 RepID=A0A1T5MGF1_9BACT|nr:MFS transporter [Ohtaekwangia koreensis]SKC87014.1 ATP/ADP translocase [Ohtaekwangia koreensis]